MRINGVLTPENKRQLLSLHEHALKIAQASMSRILLGSDLDQHPNSWWKHHDKTIEQQSDFLANDVNHFLKSQSAGKEEGQES